MLELRILEKFDTQKMYAVYDRWPEIATESYEYNYKKIENAKIDHIVFAGMGGSGALGDIFSAILSKTDVHVCVVKGYVLPKTVDKNTLVVITSISGNTVETLSILVAAKKTKCKIISFSSGGKMEDYCNKFEVEFRRIPFYHSPRASFASYLYSMLKILEPILPIEEKDVRESLQQLKKTKNIIFSKNLTKSNSALSLAEWISDIPLIYYPWGLQGAAIRFKNSLQENSKMHAITEDIIEACHNGIVSWREKSNVKPILIRGQDDFIKTQERWGIVKKYFKNKKIDFREIHSVEGSILSKLINLIYLFDYATIYKAALIGINPSPVDAIDFIKKELE